MGKINYIMNKSTEQAQFEFIKEKYGFMGFRIGDPMEDIYEATDIWLGENRVMVRGLESGWCNYFTLRDGEYTKIKINGVTWMIIFNKHTGYYYILDLSKINMMKAKKEINKQDGQVYYKLFYNDYTNIIIGKGKM